MSNKNKSNKITVQAVLDKVKSLAKLKSGMKALASKLTVKVKTALDKKAAQKELDKSLKNMVPKIKLEAETSKIVKKLKSLGRQKARIIIEPDLDNSQVRSVLEETQNEIKELSMKPIQITAKETGSQTAPSGASGGGKPKGGGAAKEAVSQNESPGILFSGVKEATLDLVEFLDKMSVLEGSVSILDQLKNKDYESMVKGLLHAAESTTRLTGALSLLDGEMSAEKLEKIGQACIGLSEGQLKLVLSAQELGNEERQAILAGMGMEEQQREQTIATLGFADAQDVATAAAFSFKGALNAIKAAWASNPVGVIVTAITTAVSLASTAFSYFEKQREEEAQALKDSIAEYDSATAELKNINAELEEHGKKLDELAAKDKLTYVEKGQLKELQELTKELRIQADMEERKAARSATEMAHGTMKAYKEEYGDYEISQDAVNEHLKYDATGANVQLADENDISKNLAYLSQFEAKLAAAKEKLSNPGNLTEHEIAWLEEDCDTYMESINELSGRLDTAYLDLAEKQANMKPEYAALLAKQANGEVLSAMEQETVKSYEAISGNLDLMYKYLFRDDWNNMEVTKIFQTENLEQTRDGLLEMAKAGKLTAETIAKDFPNLNQAIQESGIVPKEGESAAEVFCKRMREEARTWTKDVPLTFEEMFHSAEFSSGKEALMELAKSGELSPSVLLSSEQYADLLTKTKLSAEEAAEKILALLSVQEKLAAASKGLNKLKSAYDEFQKAGSVYADTLEELPDVIKQLEGFDAFSKVVSDPMQGAENMQQAFDGIVKEYLSSQDTMEALLGATDAEKQTYIANLKQMGIANAKELINQSIGILDQNRQFVNEAEAEYMQYLADKDTADTSYLESLASKNGQLANALGAPYEADYQNWCGLLEKKSEIYNEFVERIGGSYNEDLDAAGNLLANGKNVNTFSLQEYYTYKNAADQAAKEAEEASNKIRLDLLKVDPVFDPTYTPKTSASSSNPSSGSSSSNEEKEQEATVETFNFIETLLNRLASAFEKLKSAGADAFLTLAARAKSYESALSNVEKQIDTQQQAYHTYMEKAYAVGLDEYWAAQVQSGSMNLADVTDDGLKEKIKEYQEWYEKALACADAVESLKREQTELMQAKIELFVAQYDNLLEKLSGKNDRIQGRIDLKEAWGFSAGKANYKNMNKNLQQQIAYTIEQNRELENLKSTVKEGSEAWYEYNKRIDANNASLQEMKKTMAENAKAAAALAGETAASKVEKQDDKKELYDAKIDNATTAKQKNKLIDKKSGAIDRQQDAYNDAVAKDKKNLNSAKRAIKNFKGTKENKSLLKSLKKYTKSGTKIPKDVLDKAAGLNDNGKLYNACVQYNAYLEAYNADKAAAELFAETAKKEKTGLALEKFQNIAAGYERRTSQLDDRKAAIGSRIAENEAAGRKADKSAYEEQKTINERKVSVLREEKEALEQSIKDIPAGTDEWQEANETIKQVAESISECVKDTCELNDAINQIHFDAFAQMSESISNIIGEQEFLRELSAHEKMTDEETGEFTKAGYAKLGSLSIGYHASAERADRTGAEVRELQRMLESGALHSDVLGVTFNSVDGLEKKLKEMYGQWQDNIKETYSQESEIAELRKEQYNAEIELFGKLVDARKEALQAQKDLHDYQRTIAEKTDNIVTVQKQIAAYQGDSSQEALARLQKLQKELANRQEELRETEYERYISDQEELLNKLYEEYEELMTKKLEDFMQLVQSGLGLADEHLKEACDYMSKIADESGYTVETKALFDNVTNGIAGSVKEQIAKVVEAIEQNGTKAENGGDKEGEQTAYPTIDRSKVEREHDLGVDITRPIERTADLLQNAQMRIPDMQTVLEHIPPTFGIPQLPDISNILPEHIGNTRTVGDCTFQFDLPNVTDSQSLIEAIRDDSKVQRAIRDVSVGQLTGNGRLEVKGIR